MSRACTIAVVILAAAAGAASAQVPQISNGQVKTRPAGADFAAAFRALVESQTEIAWLGYTVPGADPERVMCCFNAGTTWIRGSLVTADGSACCGTCRLERSAEGTSTTRTPPAAGGVVALERSPLMAVLYRIVDRRVDGVRVFSEDCQLDAGGRAVTWIEGVRPADSVALLESLAVGGDDRRDRAGESAISAIALHGDPAADAALARLVAPGQPEAIRSRVPFWLGHSRGRSGLDLLTRLVRDDASADVRKKAVFGISQSGQPDATEVLIDAARTNPSAAVRGEAVFWLAQKAGRKAAGAISERIEQDPDTDVKKRAVFALSQLPKDEGVPLLITVARTHSNPAVRKQAFFWLGQSKDPRALDFFASVLK
jgi:HEAT repeat protein